MEASLPRVIPREYIIHKIRVYLKLELLYIILSYYNFNFFLQLARSSIWKRSIDVITVQRV